MAKHRGQAVWEGSLTEGSGRLMLPDSDLAVPYAAPARFENQEGAAAPENLIGAALAGCFSMALAKDLADAGHPPKQLQTVAEVVLNKVNTGFAITNILLRLEAEVPDIGSPEFAKLAYQAKENCPVAQLMKGAKIDLDFELNS
jgi:lipoyl-dependent peroxiredoxin